jgi:RNA polymerase sigma-70 factor (ECF subfamily)
MSQFRKSTVTGQIDLLVSAAQAGSAAAFEQLHKLYSGLVFRSAYYILRNHADAEDAMQDAFLRAYMGLSGFRKEAQFNSWITRISINSSLMILRKRRRRGELSLEGPSEADNNFPSLDFVDPSPGPEESYRWNQAHSTLLRSIKNLPTVLRSVVEERILRERSVERTAEKLGISPAAIKARLFRARKRLRRAI